MKNISFIYKLPIIIKIFYFLLLITTLFSGYIFMRVLLFHDESLFGIFSTWQFPMLLALLVDTIYLNPIFLHKKKYLEN